MPKYQVRFVVSLHIFQFNPLISALGPGSSNLIPRLTDPSRILGHSFDMKKDPKDLTMREWELIVEVFKRWPFKPEVSFLLIVL